MKRLPYVLAATLLLTACSADRTVRYNIMFNVLNKADQQVLTDMSMRVVERRVEHLGDKILEKTVETSGSGTTLRFKLETGKIREQLDRDLTKPFNLRIMPQTKPGETPTITVEGRGGFRESGITEKDLLWVASRKDPNSNRGEVRLDFTEEGKKKMRALFKEAVGRDIGLFVHDRLVSQLHVKTDSLPDNLIIRDVPTAELAQVFAEDMDVGLHVLFTPVR